MFRNAALWSACPDQPVMLASRCTTSPIQCSLPVIIMNKKKEEEQEEEQVEVE